MLAADKDQLLAHLKKQALEIRTMELDFYVEMYSAVASLASVMVGFAYVGLIKVKFAPDTPQIYLSLYFIFVCTTIAFALYDLSLASFAVVYGHGLALRGPQGSVQKAVALFIQQQREIFTVLALALLFLIGAAVMLVFIKVNSETGQEIVWAASITSVFVVFFIAVIKKSHTLFRLFHIEELVTGSVVIQPGAREGDEVDLGNLEASYADQNVADADADLDGLYHEGYLQKRGKNRNSAFKHRFFVLTSHHLWYYHTNENYLHAAGNPINAAAPIDVKKFQIVTKTGTDFSLVPLGQFQDSERTWDLRASGVQEQQEWMQKLQQASNI